MLNRSVLIGLVSCLLIGCGINKLDQNKVVIDLLELEQEIAVNEKMVEMWNINIDILYRDINRIKNQDKEVNNELLDYLYVSSEGMEMLKQHPEIYNDSLYLRKDILCDSINGLIDTSNNEIRIVYTRVCE